jgi:hypothetical protein
MKKNKKTYSLLILLSNKQGYPATSINGLRLAEQVRQLFA